MGDLRPDRRSSIDVVGNASSLQTRWAFELVIQQICTWPWDRIDSDEVLSVALAYYYFSVQFRENLETTCRQYPDDLCLQKLFREECNTSNLSPWVNVASAGEAMNHDEFMRRLLELQPIANSGSIRRAGAAYLVLTRGLDERIKAKSIASYENGGLAAVFSAMLKARFWRGEGQAAFRHFLEQHIKFDSSDSDGHGALSRHIPVDDSILPLWVAFRDLLEVAVPSFVGRHSETCPDQRRSAS
jgi:hypothetical protein